MPQPDDQPHRCPHRRFSRARWRPYRVFCERGRFYVEVQPGRRAQRERYGPYRTARDAKQAAKALLYGSVWPKRVRRLHGTGGFERIVLVPFGGQPRSKR